MSDRVRDIISGPLTPGYFQQRIAQGWVVTAVDWRKPAAEEDEAPVSKNPLQEIPYGQRVAPDCGHLVEDEYEMELLLFIYERTVSGWCPTEVATELNHRGYRTRPGSYWTAGAVFDLLPRLIELSPKLQARPDWPLRRAKLTVIA